MNDTYLKNATTRILELMKDTFGSRFNVYYDGLPTDVLPEAVYPCCTVFKSAAAITTGATGQDVLRSQISVLFLLSSTDDIQGSQDTNLTMKRLEQMIEGRDPATKQWLQGTALHALRTHITLDDDTTISLDADVEYDTTPRPDLPTVVEGRIELITEERIAVPIRN